jgi:hypothetical protein
MPPPTSLMTLAELRSSEEPVTAATRAAIPGVLQRYEGYVDALYRIPHFVRNTALEPESAEAGFHFVAWQHYAAAPATFRTIELLAERGYYTQACAIVRMLFEIFVQIRYFNAHKELLRAHLTAVSSKGRVNFKRMFDEFAPQFYERTYSLLSGFAHGGVAQTMFTVSYTAEGSEMVLSRDYNDDRATFVFNSAVGALAGFLYQAPLVFPNYTMQADAGCENARVAALGGIQEWRQELATLGAGKAAYQQRLTLLTGQALPV